MLELSVPITQLARFCHRRGDIDHRFTPSPSGPEGIAGHQRLYRKRPASYQREYAVEYVEESADLRLTVRGRADGYDPETGVVEEIKTCRVPPSSIPPDVMALHLAQGRLYAAIIAATTQLQSLTVRVTWLNIDSDEEHSQDTHFDAASLREFLLATLGAFSGWLTALARRREARDASLAALKFPYGGFRSGQRELAELTYKCIDQGGQLLLEAPTGIGKTAAVLYPALKALARGKHERVVFATAKTIGRRAAQETLAHFREAGYSGSALSLTAKDSICLSPGRACHGEDCPYARGYYDKLPAALEAALAAPALDRETLESLAGQFEVCPYELAQDMLPWMDVVIADLNYVYSLHASLAGTGETDAQRTTILLDEAHNLPERARGMYSGHLHKALVMRARRAAGGELKRRLERINRCLLALQRQPWLESQWHSETRLPEPLMASLRDFTAHVASEQAREPALLERIPPLRDLFFQALQCLRVAEQWGEDYRLQLTCGSAPQSLVVTFNCLDPARLLAARQARAHAVTAFSATLSPLAWMRGRIGLAQDAVCKRASSPFQAQQLRVQLATHIDTRFSERERTLEQLAALLVEWLAARPSNCIIYFPSYRYLADCLALLAQRNLARSVWTQQREGDDKQRQELLAWLAERRDVAAFCILGGVFGEGVDLPGDQLTSVVIVGVGMPQVNRETRELQAWYQRETGAGFDHAFLFPGMQKVDQALGRVVRRSEDCGSALLIDMRYARDEYRKLLPPWWEYHPWTAASSGE